MRGIISSTTVLIGSAIVFLIFLVATMMLTVNAVKSTTDIELVEVSRMYGDLLSDFLINSPNWYSTDKLPLASSYTNLDCGCLAWEETVDGRTVVHPGIVNLDKVKKDAELCGEANFPFCMDAAGYYWKVKVTDSTGANWEFKWWKSSIGEGEDAIIKKVIGIYDPANPTKGIQPGKLEFRIKADQLRRKIKV